jgi:hypothetical protein
LNGPKCYLLSMARRSPKPPTSRLNSWGTTGRHDVKRRFLASEQLAEIRRKQTDLNEKLWQLTAAERERRR